MCNILDMECSHPGCTRTIDMHLEDFSTDPSEIEVYCNYHGPETKDRVTEFVHRVYVKSLTDNAWEHRGGNCPNDEHELEA